MPPYPQHTIGSITIIELPARVDSVTSLDLEKQLQRLIGVNKGIICDFSQTTFISSLGLRVLLQAYKDVKRLGSEMVLCSVSDYVMEVFDISGFSRIFTMYPSRTEALPALEISIKSGGMNKVQGE
ncbi:STAS domain-containing protein [Methanocalculus taiwanensis]|uniref:STAS domain-containing protein n=1 Tax=Methanocalculus taiwanensis TaxID=106207 RepID=A0ABD4TMG4_9EURY|nr:STAS domain-containing protein [Methanocalculus taiwanensis]MCQ1538475.1 STAS domain-containing protein [Methanocalculus taiwanensis]